MDQHSIYFIETTKYLVHIKCTECNEYMNQIEKKNYYWIRYKCPKCLKCVEIEQSSVEGNALRTNEVWKEE